MQVLADKWRGGFLDYAMGPGRVRIQVLDWQELAQVPEMYVRPRRHWRTLVNYWEEFGLREVVKKVRSRLSEERFRNRKYISCGLGRLIEGAASRAWPSGCMVVFLAPCHPRCVERITLLVGLVQLVSPVAPISDNVRFFASVHGGDFPHGWSEWAGWSEFSGVPLDLERVQIYLTQAAAVLGHRVTSPDLLLPTNNGVPCESLPTPDSAPSTARLTSVCVGFGQYAKVVLLPNVSSRIALLRIHEADPMQLGTGVGWRCAIDTSDTIRVEERADVYFLAGFHHTHAPLALMVLERGAVAVVEKPVATTMTQYEELGRALARHPGKLFACFHKRYSPFNDFIWQDLASSPGSPISCFCIVYEIPLPPGHWYNWPNSGSRIISNGCHWIDHFLFLNDYAAPTSTRAHATQNGDIFVSIELENGASLMMALTDQGAPRIGVQEHVEFRAGSRTVCIQNSTDYHAEAADRILRRKRIAKALPYARMYEEISRRVQSGISGDSDRCYHISTRTILAVELVLRDSISAERVSKAQA